MAVSVGAPPKSNALGDYLRFKAAKRQAAMQEKRLLFDREEAQRRHAYQQVLLMYKNIELVPAEHRTKYFTQILSSPRGQQFSQATGITLEMVKGWKDPYKELKADLKKKLLNTSMGKADAELGEAALDQAITAYKAGVVETVKKGEPLSAKQRSVLGIDLKELPGERFEREKLEFPERLKMAGELAGTTAGAQTRAAFGAVSTADLASREKQIGRAGWKPISRIGAEAEARRPTPAYIGEVAREQYGAAAALRALGRTPGQLGEDAAEKERAKLKFLGDFSPEERRWYDWFEKNDPGIGDKRGLFGIKGRVRFSELDLGEQKFLVRIYAKADELMEGNPDLSRRDALKAVAGKDAPIIEATTEGESAGPTAPATSAAPGEGPSSAAQAFMGRQPPEMYSGVPQGESPFVPGRPIAEPQIPVWFLVNGKRVKSGRIPASAYDPKLYEKIIE